MIRSKLRNKFPKSRSACHKRAYNKQRNNCVSFLRKKKQTKKHTLQNSKQRIKSFGKPYKVFSLINQKILKLYLSLKLANCLLIIASLHTLFFQNLVPNLDLKLRFRFQILYLINKIIQLSKQSANISILVFFFKSVSHNDIEKETDREDLNIASHQSWHPIF